MILSPSLSVGLSGRAGFYRLSVYRRASGAEVEVEERLHFILPGKFLPPPPPPSLSLAPAPTQPLNPHDTFVPRAQALKSNLFLPPPLTQEQQRRFLS